MILGNLLSTLGVCRARRRHVARANRRPGRRAGSRLCGRPCRRLVGRAHRGPGRHPGRRVVGRGHPRPGGQAHRRPGSRLGRQLSGRARRQPSVQSTMQAIRGSSTQSRSQPSRQAARRSGTQAVVDLRAAAPARSLPGALSARFGIGVNGEGAVDMEAEVVVVEVVGVTWGRSRGEVSAPTWLARNCDDCLSRVV